MAQYVILNDDYLDSGYVASGFVGTDSDLYVASGYIEDAKQGDASLSAQATLTVAGGLVQDATSTLDSAFSASIDADVIADAIGTSSSSFTVATIDAVKTTDTDSGISTAISASITAVKTVDADITTISAFSSSIDANATVSPGGSISTSATTAVTAVKTVDAVVGTINGFQTHPTLWSDDISWNDPAGTIWGPMVIVSANAFVNGESSISSSITLTVDGDVTAVAEIAPAAVATVAVTGTVNFEANANISSSVSVDTTANKTGDIANLEFASAFTVTSSGIFQVAGDPEAIDAAFTVTADGDTIADGVAIKAGVFDLTSTPLRIRPFEADISSAFTLTASGEATAEGVSIVASAGTLDITAVKTVRAVETLDAVFDSDFRGGILFGGIIDIQAFVTTVSALTIFNIDPFRVYPVDVESRLLQIVPESRIYNTKTETRINIITEEDRNINVKSETRTVEVQPLELVEVAGNPLDRRQG